MRLLLADDHDLVLEGFRSMIEFFEPNSTIITVKFLDAVLTALAEQQAFDVILLDLNMPGMNGVQGVRRLLSAYPHVCVAIITGLATRETMNASLAAGAKGFLPKTLTGRSLIAALQVLAAGDVYVPMELMSNESRPALSLGRARDSTDQENLTQREQQVAAMLVEGASNKEIARHLKLQEVTVKLHIRNLCQKLGVKNRTQIAVRRSQQIR